MAWLRGSAAAVVIEVVAWQLGLSWGFALLMIAFVGMAVPMAAKTRTTEQRVNAIQPVLAAHAAGIAAAQGTANGAQGTANTANNSANNAQGTANSAAANAQTAIDFINNGGTIGGDLHVNGNFFTSNNVNCASMYSSGDSHVGGNFFSAGTANSGGQTNSGGDLHADAAFYIGGQRIQVPQTRAGGLASAPSSYTQSWGNSVDSFCAAMNVALLQAGIVD